MGKPGDTRSNRKAIQPPRDAFSKPKDYGTGKKSSHDISMYPPRHPVAGNSGGGTIPRNLSLIGQMKQVTLHDYAVLKSSSTSVSKSTSKALTHSESLVELQPQILCSPSESGHADGITSQDLFCTPDYITPVCQNLLNASDYDKEDISCPKAPDKMNALVNKKRRIGAKVGSHELNEIMGIGSDVKQISESALSIRCTAITPHCHKNPFLKQASRNYSDPHSAKNSKLKDRFPEKVVGVCTSRYRENFYEIEKIGQGNFNTIFKALHRLDGVLYAIKYSTNALNGEIEWNKALREVWVMAAVGYHENIVLYSYSWVENDRLYIMMELCDHCLSIQKSTNLFTEEQAYRFIHQIAGALMFMHDKGITHMDIKPSNIFVKNDVYKLGDFGCSIGDNNDLDDAEGDGRYMAPEIMNKIFDHLDKGDIFSLGASIYELVTGSLLGESKSPNPTLLSTFSLQFQNIIMAMLDLNPICRPSAKEIVRNSIFVKATNIQE